MSSADSTPNSHREHHERQTPLAGAAEPPSNTLDGSFNDGRTDAANVIALVVAGLFPRNGACLAFECLQRRLLRQQYVAYRQFAIGQKAPSRELSASGSEFVDVQVISMVDAI